MSDMFSLAGRKALGTGGIRGIGAAIVSTLVGAGAEVAFCHYDDAAKAESVIGSLAQAGALAYAMHCDVADAAAVEAICYSREGSLDLSGQDDDTTKCRREAQAQTYMRLAAILSHARLASAH